MKPRILLAALFAALLLAPAAQAGRLADLPWDDSIPSEIRGAVRRALTEESRETTKERNEHDKKFIDMRTNKHVELLDDKKAVTHVTIQRCLEDKMSTAYWRYTLAPKSGGPDYEIVDRQKVFENDEYLPNVIEDQPRRSAAFEFTHDKLSMTASAGSFFVERRGPNVSGIRLAASGRVRIEPLNDYEKMFFERRLKTDRIDTTFEAVEIDFHETDTSFMALVGDAAVGSGTAVSMLDDLQKRAWGERKKGEREYTPGEYGRAPRDVYRGNFSIRLKTKDHGWVGYVYTPTGSFPSEVKEILVYREKQGFSFRSGPDSFELVSHYHSPETRSLSRRDRANRQGIEFASPYRYDAMFHIDRDGIIATVDVDLNVLQATDRLNFGVFGAAKIRFVRMDLVKDLPYFPAGGGYEIQLPERVEAGSQLRLRIGYETEWPSGSGVGKITEGFWLIPRGGFLPFSGVLSDPSYMHFVVRTKDDYQHIAIGSMLAEEIQDGYRYTEWGADYAINFPTIIIGQYFDPVVQEIDGVKISGYMTKSFFEADPRIPVSTRKDMEPHVQMAAESIRLFTRLFEMPYPYKELKLVGTPAQFLSAQSPSSIVYVGEGLFWPPAVQADLFKTLDPTAVKWVTPHEIGHQWWGGLVSNRNNAHYWFVESLADLSAAFFEAATREDGQYPSSLNAWRKATLQSDWSCAIPDDMYRMEAPGVQPLRYTKGPYVMHMLGEYFGRDKLIAYLKNVIQNHSGDLITTWDLQRTAEETFGFNMEWFFDQWIRGNGIPRVSYQYSTRAAEDGKSWMVSGLMKQVVTLKGDPQEGRYFENLLVPVRVTLSNGETVTRRVIMNGPEQSFDLSVPGKPRQVELNPDDKLLIEVRKL